MNTGPIGAAGANVSTGVGPTGPTCATNAGNVATATLPGTANARGGTDPAKNAADFLSRVVPWPTAGAPGVVNLHWRAIRPNGNSYWDGRPHTKLDSFATLTRWCLGKPDTIKDLYFCLSRQAKTRTTKRGKLAAARNTADALALKAVWLDIDVKAPPKGYPSLDDAQIALDAFIKQYKLPSPTAIVGSGGGLHVYWISDRELSPAEWRPYAEGLKAAVLLFGLRCDAGLTTDAVRVMRVPGTFNWKTEPPRPVKLINLAPDDLDFDKKLAILPPLASTGPGKVTATVTLPKEFENGPHKAFAHLDPLKDNLSAGIEREEMPPLDIGPIVKGCAFIRDALETGGKDYSEPMWNLTTLAATFFEDGNALAHKMGCQHPGYTKENTEEKWTQKLRARAKNELGWPQCKTIHESGCTACTTCAHLTKGKSPLNLAHQQQSPPAEPSFVDPYGDFVGPEFPLEVLPPTLANFVDAEHRAMGADPAALAMAALTVVAGAIHAETRVRAGEGWWEKPILWTALVGQPSTKKSPIIDKTTKPLTRIDHERQKQWRQEYAIWQSKQK